MKYPKSQMRGSGMNGRIVRRIQRRQELESIWRMEEPILEDITKKEE